MAWHTGEQAGLGIPGTITSKIASTPFREFCRRETSCGCSAAPEQQQWPKKDRKISSWMLSSQNDGSYLVENVLELVLSQGRALYVFHGSEFSCHALAILLADGRHFLF